MTCVCVNEDDKEKKSVVKISILCLNFMYVCLLAVLFWLSLNTAPTAFLRPLLALILSRWTSSCTVVSEKENLIIPDMLSKCGVLIASLHQKFLQFLTLPMVQAFEYLKETDNGLKIANLYYI